MKCNLFVTGSCHSGDPRHCREHHKDFPYRGGKNVDLVDVPSAVNLLKLSGWEVKSFKVVLCS